MRIAFYGLQMWEREYLETHIGALADDNEIIYSEKDISPINLPEEKGVEILSVFADSVLDRNVIASLPNLKMIALRSTGFDHVDIFFAKEQGITVSNVPSYGEITVAEYTFGLILALSRKIYEGYDQIRESGSFSQDKLQGFDLSGKTLGVIGTGRIGCHVAQIAKGFGMKVLAYDVNPNQTNAKEVGFEYRELDEVLAEADVVSLHIPHNKETHHLMNKETLYKMKKGAYLINTARGGIVETEVLLEVLQSGHLSGAGLDVLEEEGIIGDELSFLRNPHPEEHNLRAVLANHVLIDMPNVIITPHNAFNTKEALERILITTIDNIGGFLKDKPKNIV